MAKGTYLLTSPPNSVDLTNINSAPNQSPLVSNPMGGSFNMKGGIEQRVVTLASMTSVKGSAPVATDTFDLLQIDPGDFVKSIKVRVITPVSGGTVSGASIALSDSGSDSNDFLAAFDLTQAAGTVGIGEGSYFFTQSGASPYTVAITGGKFYAALDAVKATLSGTWTGAIVGTFEIIAEVIKLGSGTPSTDLSVIE
jgi:hypothetical protein